MMRIECNCERHHHEMPVKTIEISEHAVEKVPEILKDYHHILMVSDGNTYEVAGRRVEELLKASGQLFKSVVMPVPTVADEKALGRILIEAGEATNPYDINAGSVNCDYILAVGGGSLNDSCRMVAFRMGLEYGVCGTAPSMDGYASVVAPLLCKGGKYVYNCTIARHIIIDLNVNQNAPYPLLLSGLGDILAKYIALLDWEISRDLNGEYYCGTVADMVRKATDQALELSVKLKDRDMGVIRSISEGLILSGEGIAYTGSSRPASGTEHMIGQTWEIMDVEEGKNPNLHGIEVGEGVFEAIEMFRRLYKETNDPVIKPLIEKYLPKFDEVEAMQKIVKLPFTVVDKDRFIEGTLRGRTFRDRYTILQYLYDRGMLEDYASYAYDEVMKKHFFGTFNEQFPDWRKKY